jgi:hypothetical protein
MRRTLVALTALSVLVGAAGASTPAPAPTSLRIMTIGDSINTGLGSADGCGYRSEVQQFMDAAGVAVTWTGELNGTGANDCEIPYGHFGATVQDLKNSVTAWMAADMPAVVLIQIGTRNAAGQGAGLTGFQLDYQWLIQYIFNASPTVKVIASYVPYSVAFWAANEVSANISIIGAVQAFLPYYNGRLLLVNNSRLPCKFLADGIHPYFYDPIGRWYYDGLVTLYGLPPLPSASYYFLDQPRPGYERVATVCPA